MAGIEIATGELTQEMSINCQCICCQQGNKIIRKLKADHEKILKERLVCAFIQGATWWNDVGSPFFAVSYDAKRAARRKFKKGILGVNL